MPDETLLVVFHVVFKCQIGVMEGDATADS